MTSAALLEELGSENTGRALGLVDVALLILDEHLSVVQINDYAQCMLGRTSTEMLGQPLCADLAGSVVCELVGRVRRGGVEATFECPCPLRSDPGWCHVRCIPFGGGVALIVRDLTDIRRNEELYRSVVETAADGIIVIDEDGRIDSVNPAVELIFGYAAGELVGRNVSVLMPEPFRSEHDAYLRRYLKGGEERVIGIGREVRGQGKDGSSFPIHLAVAEMVVGGLRKFTGIVSDLTERTRIEEELRRVELRNSVLAEQAVLRRVATAVARETDPARIFDLVAEETAHHLDVAVGLVCRFDEDRGVIVGQWSSGPRIAVLTLPLTGGGALAQVARTGAPARVDDYASLVDDPIAPFVAAEFYASVAAPIFAPGGVWGAVLASTTHPKPFPPGAEQQLAEFAELVTMAVANAADRACLVALAASDSLTGLANHRVFHERLRGEARRAERHRRPLALVMLDVDHFKRVNDTHGHAVGDKVLLEITRRLLAEAREGELIARIGGEEFAWILPDTDIAGAREAAERARRVIAELPFPTVGTVTISMGTCDLARAGDADQLFLFADGALYWAKRQGRNMVCDYEQGELHSLSPEEHVARLERSQAVNSVRVLARAVDAKDHSTREHSARVAEMAVRVASARGWDPDQIARLHEAGVVHDVGKIGVPDAVLFKRGRLTPDEYEIIKQHAELGARIVSGIVTAEQAAWVRHHHERFDGGGYPDGLAGSAIPEGARILALADAWDVMTSERAYKERAFGLTEALEECRRQAGLQFCPKIVRALEQLWEAGGLGSDA